MKQMVNFRLDSKSIATLVLLEKELHASKTAILEQALLYFAKIKLPERDSLLKFAGTLREKDADEMLEIITENKHNKEILVDL